MTKFVTYLSPLLVQVTPYCRSEKVRSNGKAPIVLYLKRKGFPRSMLTTPLKVDPKYFNNDSGKFKPGAGDAMKLNASLSTIISEIEGIALDNPSYSSKEICAQYKKGNSANFFDFMQDELRADGHGGIQQKTYENYQYVIRLLKKLWGEVIPFNHLTVENIRLLEYELKTRNYSINTRKQILKALRKYTKRALQQNKIKKNPFDEYKVGGFVSSEREWNTIDEMDLLKELILRLDEIPERLHSTLVHYMHSCHCGLRMIDSRRFNPDEHVVGNFIKMAPTKTRDIKVKLLTIPINEYAKSLHPLFKQLRPLKLKTSRVIKDLTDICEIAGIDKHISFHCARHSFAINSLIQGVTIETVSKWLGHESIATTQIYARIVDSLSQSEMQKWNNQGERSTLVFKKNKEDKYFIQLPDLGIESTITFDSINEAKMHLIKSLGK